jgi:PAS domain S-box-containing protein
MMAVTTVRREDGSTPYRVGTILDVTEHKRTEAALRAAEARFRSYIDNSPAAVVVLDAAGAIVDCNPATCAMFRSEAAAMRGQHVRLLHRAEDLSEVLDHLAALRRDGRVQREYQMQRADGTTFWAIVSTALLPDDGSIGFMQDIDQLKQAEAQQMRTHRLTLLGEMAAGLAHELKQPLAAISMAAEYATELLTVDRDIDGAAAELRGVIEQAQRAAGIIRDVQLFGRAEVSATMPASVADALGGTLSIVHRRLQETATAVVQSLPPDLPEVMLARVKLEQVLSNLILNACDAYAVDDAPERLIAIAAWRDGQDVMITVADRAGGIPNAVLPRVCDSAWKIDPLRRGIGVQN